MTVAACPYCGVVLESVPRKSKQCEECGETYCVRSKTQLFNTKVLSKYQADASDFFDKLTRFGATIDDYLQTGRELERKWKRKPSYSDTLWALSNVGLIERGMKPYGLTESVAILDKAKELAVIQAEYHLRLGNDPRIILAMANAYDVESAKMLYHNDDLFFYINSNGCCLECETIHGLSFSAADIEDNEYVPMKSCTRKQNPDDEYAWCICYYTPLT